VDIQPLITAPELADIGVENAAAVADVETVVERAATVAITEAR